MQLDDLKILICDDSILARKQMKDIINSIGSAVCESGAGDKATDSADTGRNPGYYVPFGERSAGRN